MKICGIITEYNPFHYGHKLHLDSAKLLTKSDAVVCVMSGNFMQRGTPALLDKWQRSKIAIESGVDLVIELPTLFSVSSAEFFAKGAINILNNIPNVDSLFFGSEEGSTALLELCANILVEESPSFKKLIKNSINLGTPYTIARAEALYSLINENITINKDDFFKFLNSSNNILGLEYTKALIKSNSTIKPFTFKRQKSSYNSKELTGKISSATSIREALKTKTLPELKDILPKETYSIMASLKEENYEFINEEKMFPFIKYKIITNPESLKSIPECSEGLDKKIIKELPNSNSLEELIMNVKSKRYTYTRISRILTQLYIGMDKFNIDKLRNSQIDYIRVLGCNNKGREILKSIKNQDNVKIITKFPKKTSSKLLEMDLLATNAYHILNSKVRYNEDYYTGPYIKF